MLEPLNYKTHRAYDPLYHFFVLPAIGINVLIAAFSSTAVLPGSMYGQ